MIIISIFSVLGQSILFVIIKLAHFLKLITTNTYNKFLLWIIKFNGPVSIKVFQILSSSPEFNKIGGADLIKKLETLQSNVYPHKRKLFKRFKYKSRKPIASGTIGQIYLVELPDALGTTGILKVAHSYIDQDIISSVEKLKIAKALSKFILPKFYKILRNINLTDFKNLLLLQTNFDYEYQNLIKFQKVFNNYEMIKIPNVIKHNKKYLLMTKEEGLHINDFMSKYPNHNDECVALLYSSIYLMITKCIIHGDLHFGNFLFKLDNHQVKISILDFGIICYLNELQSNYLLAFLKSKSTQNKHTNLINFILSIVLNKNSDFITTEYKNNITLMQNTKSNELLEKILSDNRIEIPSNFISLFTTLKIILDLQKTCKKNNPMFSSYLAGYMMENDFD